MNKSEKMIFSRKIIGVIVAGLSMVLLYGALSRAQNVLIEDIEKLRTSLPLRDPSRPALTLRLADLLFDEVGELSRGNAISQTQQLKVTEYRKRALSLYGEALSGENGMFSTPQGSLKIKLQFQRARLLADLGQSNEALILWNELVKQTTLQEIQREAALRLAENFEEKGDFVQARGFFTQALELCAGGDVCYYARYRRAWIAHRESKWDESLAEMKMALTDSKGQLREEPLKDLILFYSKVPNSSGEKALVEVEEIANRYNRKNLVSDLADGFYAAGNKQATIRVLEYLNQRQPDLHHQVQLLEEYYGQRNWVSFGELTEKLTQQTPETLKALDEVHRVEVEKIIRRLTVQLDGERLTQKDRVAPFESAVMLYLKLLPESSLRSQMMEGWMAAETDSQRKLDQIKIWIGEEEKASRFKQVERLREVRASVAQKAGQHEVVAQEMEALVRLAPSLNHAVNKIRENKYLFARALYELKAYEKCLPLFIELAKPETGVALGDSVKSIESQNLALDILGSQKRFSEVVAQADTWLNEKVAISKNAKMIEEIADIRKIRDAAEFEGAVQNGKTMESLAVFKKYCLDKKQLPKSCENAQILALQLKDQDALIAILKAQNKTAELAAELEASGRFVEAAVLLEPQALTQDQRIKVALLYELGEDFKSQSRVLRLAAMDVQKQKTLGEQEPLLFETFKDSKLLDPKALKWAWSQPYRFKIADELQTMGQGNLETQKILLSSKSYVGQSWAHEVLNQIRQAAQSQAKIGFYGARGQAKFQSRLAGLKKLVDLSQLYLEGADWATRLSILETLKTSHEELALQILQSPIPEAVQGQDLANLKASLEELAHPFKEKAAAYEKLLGEQKEKAQKIESTVGSAQSSGISKGNAIEILSKNPQDLSALKLLKEFYAQNGNRRLSSYFQGRMNQLQKEGSGP